jgi:NAD(P)-dependent dehydrogenase (short-subunit alcohol dehydrogenase family)
MTEVNNMGRITGKACIVTGCGSGIGRAIAERFAEEGGKLVCVDINAEANAATVAGIQAQGGTAIAFPADISNSQQMDALVADWLWRGGCAGE